jgi:hypothetical protein
LAPYEPPGINAVTDRAHLPNRSPHELFDFEHGGFRFTAGVPLNTVGWRKALTKVFIPEST